MKPEQSVIDSQAVVWIGNIYLQSVLSSRYHLSDDTNCENYQNDDLNFIYW